MIPRKKITSILSDRFFRDTGLLMMLFNDKRTIIIRKVMIRFRLHNMARFIKIKLAR